MLIDEIIDLLSRNEGGLSEALLKTKVLLHKVGRKDLIGWVNAELNGYSADSDVPPYRIVSARVLANVAAYTFTANSHPIPIRHLDDEERRRLERHEIREPIGVLEARDSENKLIVPLPMEANGRLGENLAEGVRINSAWCELNEQQVQSISINVRSRLLDFVLEMRDAVGDGVEDGDISEKSKHIDASSMFSNAMFGPNATIIYGTDSAQVRVNVQPRNLMSLEAALQKAGVPTEEISELKQAIANDQANGRESMEGDVGNWFTRLLGKATKGTIGVGVDVVSSTVAKAITSYMQGA